MQTIRRVAAVALLGAVVLAGCKTGDDTASTLPRPSRAFCAAAAQYDQHVQLASLTRQIRLVTPIAASAPKDIAADAKTFLDALERRSRGDKSVVDNPKIQAAVDHVNRRAGQDCGWYQRKGL